MNEYYLDKFYTLRGFLEQTYTYTLFKDVPLSMLANPDPAWVAGLDVTTQGYVNTLKAYAIALLAAPDPNYSTPGFWTTLSAAESAIIAGSKSGDEYLNTTLP